MTPSARVAAAIDVLDDIFGGRTAEKALSAWARGSRFAGSKDRAALRDLVFDALRMRASCAALGGGLHGRGLMVGLGINDGWDMSALFSGDGHGAEPLTETELALLDETPALSVAEQYDLPAWLWPIWSADLGDMAEPAAQALRARAPLYLRINARRSSVEDVVAALALEGIETAPHAIQKGCVEVLSNPRRVKVSAPYSDGLVEIQDAASQMAVARLEIPAGSRVLDYCAGGGGKALALADRFECDVVAHDVAAGRMKDIPARADRANVEITVCETDGLNDAGLFDVVVVDAPCSGSGTWRRNPEAKWGITHDKLHEFRSLQGEVLANAARYLRPGGKLVYMTCSVFRAENEDVVAGFLAAQNSFSAASSWRLRPDAASDGFFCQVLS